MGGTLINMDKSQIIYDKLLAYMQMEKPLTEQNNAEIQVASARHINDYLGEVCQNIAIMERTRSNHAYRELRSNRILAPIILLVKKSIRKCLKWYIEPICYQQTEFNNAVTPAVGRLTQSVTELYQLYSNQGSPYEDRNKSTLENLEKAVQIQADQIKGLLGTDEKAEKKVELLEKELETFVSEVKNIHCNLDEKISSVCLRSEHLASRLDSQGARMDQYSDLFNSAKETSDEIEKIHLGISDLKQENTAIKQKHAQILSYINENQGSLLTAEKDIKQQELQNCMNLIAELQKRITRLEEMQSKKFNPWDKRTTSQAGEDSILLYLLPHLRKKVYECTYLDLGANHAIELSNTYSLYERGARGVLVEANPSLIPELQEYRSGDIILNRCIYSETDKTMSFYIMSGDGLSSMDLESIQNMLHKNPSLKVESVLPVKTITIEDILKQYFSQSAPTFVNIDVEGMEFTILKNWDFEHYRPAVFIVEMIPYRPTLVIGEKNKEIINFMESVGYIEYAFTGINSIFVDKSSFQ